MTQEKINTKPGSPQGRETDHSYQAASTCTLFSFFNPPACRNYLKPHLPPSCGAGPTSLSYWVNGDKSIKEPEGRGRTGHHLVQRARPVRFTTPRQKQTEAYGFDNRHRSGPNYTKDSCKNNRVKQISGAEETEQVFSGTVV